MMVHKRKSYQSQNFNEIPHQQKQSIFAIGVIILSAKLAKADGVVTKDEIYAFKEKFNVSKNDMEKVSSIFNEAKKSTYGFEPIAMQIQSLFKNNQIVLEELLNNLFYIAEADGNVSNNELEYLKVISNIFHFDEKTFNRIYATRQKSKNTDPYKVLGANRDDSDSDIRKAWLKLTKDHHPDNLIAKGMPAEFIEQANNEMSSINTAYDRIQKMRN